MANKSNVFCIDDGTREITLQNEYGEEICKIHIRAGDISIVDRFEELKRTFGEVVKPLEQISIKNDGSSDNDSDWKVIKQAEQILKEKLNKLFDTDDVGKIFERRSPFSAVKGRYFFENVMDVLGTIVSQTVEEEAKLSEKRVSKYLGGVADAGKSSDNA